MPERVWHGAKGECASAACSSSRRSRADGRPSVKYDAEDEVRHTPAARLFQGIRTDTAHPPQNPNGFRPGTMKIVKSEKEIFELLGLPYVRPLGSPTSLPLACDRLIR